MTNRIEDMADDPYRLANALEDAGYRKAAEQVRAMDKVIDELQKEVKELIDGFTY